MFFIISWWSSVWNSNRLSYRLVLPGALCSVLLKAFETDRGRGGLSWAALTWRFNEDRWANAFPHPLGHIWFRFPSCTASTCDSKWPLLSKRLPQTVQENLLWGVIEALDILRGSVTVPGIGLCGKRLKGLCEIVVSGTLIVGCPKTSVQYRDAPTCGLATECLRDDSGAVLRRGVEVSVSSSAPCCENDIALFTKVEFRLGLYNTFEIHQAMLVLFVLMSMEIISPSEKRHNLA